MPLMTWKLLAACHSLSLKWGLGAVEFKQYLPENTSSAVVQPLGDEGVLVAGSDTQRGFGPLDQVEPGSLQIDLTICAALHLPPWITTSTTCHWLSDCSHARLWAYRPRIVFLLICELLGLLCWCALTAPWVSGVAGIPGAEAGQQLGQCWPILSCCITDQVIGQNVHWHYIWTIFT